MLEYFPEWTVASAWLAGLNLEGKLTKVYGYVDEESGTGMHGVLKELSTNSHKGIPQAANLAGSVYLYPNGFLFELDSSGVRVRFPNVFEHLWYAEKLSGELFDGLYPSYVCLEFFLVLKKFLNSSSTLIVSMYKVSILNNDFFYLF